MFKVGDIVKGISNQYIITTVGWVGIVIEVNDHSIRVCDIEGGGLEYCVDPDDFELLAPEQITQSFLPTI